MIFLGNSFSFNKAWLLIKFYLAGSFIRASAVLFLGGLVVGLLGYIYQVLMGRFLGPEEYGLFIAAMGLFTIFSAPGNTLTHIISRKIAEYQALEDYGGIRFLYKKFIKGLLVIGIAIILFTFFFSSQIGFFLKTLNNILVLLLGVLAGLNLLIILNLSFLQGLQKFVALSLSNGLGVILKIGICVLFAYFGFGVSGVLFGIIISFLVLLGITGVAIEKSVPLIQTQLPQKPLLNFLYDFPVLIANLIIAFTMQADMLLVNFLFSEKEASMYAAASVLGKAAIYLSGAITIAAFPIVAKQHALNQSSIQILKYSLLITFILTSLGSIFYYIFGEFIISKLYGISYTLAGNYLKWYGLMMVPLSLILLVENFLIAKKQVLFSYLFLLFLPIAGIALYFFHNTPVEIIFVIGVLLCMQFLVGIWIINHRLIQGKIK